MATCVKEKGSECLGMASVIVSAREGGWENTKCEPCAQTFQRRMGRIFDQLYRISPLPAGRMRCHD